MSDENDGIQVTRRRLLGGITAMGAVSAAAGGWTWAAFRDEEQSEKNYVQAGTFDLKLSESDENNADGVSGEITLSNAKPGDTVLGDIALENAGSVEADHVEMAFSYDEQESSGPNGNNEADTKPTSAEGMAKQFKVTGLSYDNQNVLNNLADANGNGRVDIDDLTQNANTDALDNLSPPPAANGGTESFFAEFEFADDPANNDYQGDELTITVTFGLFQDQSQDL